MLLKNLTIISDSLKNKQHSIIKNSYTLITSIKNFKNQYQHINTYDFKDLFNNICIDDLNKVILNLFNQVNSAHPLDFNKGQFKSLLNFVTNNCFLYQNNTIYKQIKGVPQGSPSSSQLANMFLSNFETVENIEDNMLLYRYIDDIIIFSKNPIDTPSFYPNYLELIKSNNNSNNINFLDINIYRNDNGDIITDIYDKRNDYEFEIAKSQYFHSCLHRNVFRNIIVNQLIRINRLCSNININKQVELLKKHLQKYNYPKIFVNNLINRFKFHNS